MLLKSKLKHYDKYLYLKKTIEGKIQVLRKSPFSARREYEILEIKNQYLGEGSWILRNIILMDTQKYNIIGEVSQYNKNNRFKKEDKRFHEDVANLMLNTQINI